LAVVRRRAARRWARWGGSRISETSLLAIAAAGELAGRWGEDGFGGNPEMRFEISVPFGLIIFASYIYTNWKIAGDTKS
jgi:hypothetical protein